MFLLPLPDEIYLYIEAESVAAVTGWNYIALRILATSFEVHIALSIFTQLSKEPLRGRFSIQACVGAPKEFMLGDVRR